MHATLPLLTATHFPPMRRAGLQTLQVNLGYRCNQSCVHCHVNASPQRTEEMSAETIRDVLNFLNANKDVHTLDLTGGAPELNPHFRFLVRTARDIGVHVIDRCNLTILEEPGQKGLAAFLAAQGVHVVASLPCYSEDNVDMQRGDGVFGLSIKALQRLNELGYGKPGHALRLDLVYNPIGASLPPSQDALEVQYKALLGERFQIEFNRLLTLANMPIKRFGSTLVSKGQFAWYMDTLRKAHREENMAGVMCRTTLSVDWQGRLYDCDFNQQLELGISNDQTAPLLLKDITADSLMGRSISVAGHCYGCTAGQGSSCGGALETPNPIEHTLHFHSRRSTEHA